MLKPPRLAVGHPDRYIECEEMMGARIVALMDRARELGWSQNEVTSAVTELAFNYVLRQKANEETDRQGAAAMARCRLRSPR